MLLLFSIRVALFTCLGKSGSFGLQCVSSVNVSQFVCVPLSGWDVGFYCTKLNNL